MSVLWVPLFHGKDGETKTNKIYGSKQNIDNEEPSEALAEYMNKIINLSIWIALG
jgi:hypothetical protein